MDPDETTRDGMRACVPLSLHEAIELVDNDMSGVGDAGAVILAAYRENLRELNKLRATIREAPAALPDVEVP